MRAGDVGVSGERAFASQQNEFSNRGFGSFETVWITTGTAVDPVWPPDLTKR